MNDRTMWTTEDHLDNGAFRVVTEESELRNHAIDDDSDTDEDDDDYVAGPVAPRPSGGSHAQSCRRGQDHRVRSVRIPAQRTENQMGGPTHFATPPGGARGAQDSPIIFATLAGGPRLLFLFQ